uniref:(California timema) hypothetical protein n=1 Tax=Timema californicum TaxID=61474 RepID=A0A7R9JG54_TIMCA|nr:unnamed protein product [Timema californicum]
MGLRIEPRPPAQKSDTLPLDHQVTSDRMKPGSGDWAVTINFLQEAAITYLSIGSSVKFVSLPLPCARRLAREYAKDGEHSYTDKLKRIQCILVDINTCILRTSQDRPRFSPRHTNDLEDWITEYSNQLPPLENYVIPGGGKAASSLHVARSICRRAERCVIPLVRTGDVDRETQVYLNRLSDFLLTVSRVATRLDKKDESIYIPRPETSPHNSQRSCLLCVGSTTHVLRWLAQRSDWRSRVEDLRQSKDELNFRQTARADNLIDKEEVRNPALVTSGLPRTGDVITLARGRQQFSVKCVTKLQRRQRASLPRNITVKKLQQAGAFGLGPDDIVHLSVMAGIYQTHLENNVTLQ